MGNQNGISGIFAIFGLILGIFLAFVGVQMVQDLAVEMNAMDQASGEVCASNPIPLINFFQPEVCQSVDYEVGIHKEITVTGLGMVLLVSMLMLIFIIIFGGFMLMMFNPAFTGMLFGYMLFSIFFLLSFILSWFLGLNIVAVFG